MKSTNNNDIPKWLKYLILLAAILYLLITLFQIINPNQTDWPIH
jgi:hypothetical protein